MAAPFFQDREQAGHELAQALARFGHRHPLVLGIPRGGMPVARVVADALGGELDVLLVRKLGAPGNPELAIGAIDESGHIGLTEFADPGLEDSAYLRSEARRQWELIRERRARYRPGRAALEMAGRTVIVVDDGLATGATMTAALRFARAAGPARLVCAVPVASRESLADVAALADEVECLATPSPFHAVGLYYRDFSPVQDEQVIALLEGAEGDPGESPRLTPDPAGRTPAPPRRGPG